MEPAQVFVRQGESLSPLHEELIENFLVRSEWELRQIPSEGLTKDEVNRLLKEHLPPTAVIFASYDPLLLALFCRRVDQAVYLFCKNNDDNRLELCLV